MRKTLFILSLLLLSSCLWAQAQDSAFVWTPDPIEEEVVQMDTVVIDSARLFWKPDPMRAVWMGLIIPGYGQIYNKAYWKLPIVYGGFMGCIYAITWNNRMYTDYKNAYRDILTDTDGTKTSYLDILPEGYTVEMMGGKQTYTNTLQNRQNMYRQYRDYAIVATIVVYALSVIDAYVDAQLFDYDISTDLSMHVYPQVVSDPFNRKSAELYLAIDF